LRGLLLFGITLGLAGADGSREELSADHVIAATGFRTDLSRLPFIGDGLRSELRVLAGSCAVGRDYQSSVPGLYFIGPAVAPTFGPVMRFVCGSGYPARAVSRQLAATAAGRSRAAVPAGR